MFPPECSFSLQITLALVALTLIPCCLIENAKIGLEIQQYQVSVLHSMLSGNTIH